MKKKRHPPRTIKDIPVKIKFHGYRPNMSKKDLALYQKRMNKRISAGFTRTMFFLTINFSQLVEANTFVYTCK